MKQPLLRIICFIVNIHTTIPQLTDAEISLIEKQFPHKSYFTTAQHQILNKDKQDLEQRLNYLIAFMKKTGSNDDNLEMPEAGMKNSSDFLVLLYLHPAFQEHPERKNFIELSQILVQRSKNFLQIMSRSKSCHNQ